MEIFNKDRWINKMKVEERGREAPSQFKYWHLRMQNSKLDAIIRSSANKSELMLVLMAVISVSCCHSLLYILSIVPGGT